MSRYDEQEEEIHENMDQDNLNDIEFIWYLFLDLRHTSINIFVN
jgi:hypothetical protein